MDWRILAFSVPLLFASYQTLSKLLPTGTSIFLVNAYASLVGFGLMLLIHFLTSSDKSVRLDGKHLWLAIVIGVLISLGNFGIIKAYSLGAPQSLFTPFFYVALILYGVILGLIFWNERLNPLQALGMILAVAGLAMTAYFRNK